MGNLHAIGVQELTCEQQRALVGGGGMIARIVGWAVGAVGGGIANIVDAALDAADDFGNGFRAGYAESRG